MKQTIITRIVITLLVLTSTAFSAGTIDPPGEPLVTYYYQVEVNGILSGYFTQMSKIGSVHEVVEHKVVTPQGEETQKIPGRLSWHDITLTRGITSSMDVWTWRQMVEDGNVAGARSSMSITLLDQEGTPAAQWNFDNVWPSSVSASSDADGNVIEELVIVYEYCERVM